MKIFKKWNINQSQCWHLCTMFWGLKEKTLNYNWELKRDHQQGDSSTTFGTSKLTVCTPTRKERGKHYSQRKHKHKGSFKKSHSFDGWIRRCVTRALSEKSWMGRNNMSLIHEVLWPLRKEREKMIWFKITQGDKWHGDGRCEQSHLTATEYSTMRLAIYQTLNMHFLLYASKQRVQVTR